MKQEQVITITADGSIKGLQRKDGFDLRQMGEADINRVSEVVWEKQNQKWYVKFLQSETVLLFEYDRILDEFLIQAADENWPFEKWKELYYTTVHTPTAYFDEYEDAVQAEIKTLDYLRIVGQLV